MSASIAKLRDELNHPDWPALARALGPVLAERAAAHDRSGEFVAANYDDLRERGFFAAGIPAELDGGGASFQELAGIIRELGRYCGSTALAFSMHTHPLAANVFKYLRGDEAAAEVLRRLASGRLAIATTGANDWLQSSGTAEKVDGGFRVNARKRFVSGSPGAQVFVTSVGFQGGEGSEVLHFSVPMSMTGVAILETWDTIGMRGTGSHDVILTDVFVPDRSVMLRRPAGVWHPVWNVIIPIAMPLITSAYLGQAEAAVELALNSAGSNHADLASAVGEMMNSLTVVRLAVADMVRINDDYRFDPGMQTTNDILARKAIATQAVRETVETACEIVGGPGFYRGHAMERIVRDVRAMHFHPLPVRRQQVFSGRLAMGVDPIKPA